MAVRWITEADTSAPLDPSSALYVEMASWILYKLTAEKYPGVTKRTEWYGVEGNCYTCNSVAFTSVTSILGHGHIFYRSPLTQRIRLRGTPVQSIESVTYQGAVLSPESYYVEGSTNLVLRGGDCWDLNSGVEVVYNSGIRPPEAGRLAAIRLANEFILAATNASACSLPDRVTAVSRQGVDYTILDPQDFLDQGKTGIYEIDLFIKAANPINAKKKPRVFSPDMLRGATRT